jgi:hypothetical protein
MTTATNYSADDTALTIVDPYNDFMSEVGKFEGHIDVWRNKTIEKNALICDMAYNETGTYSGEGHTRDECITERTDRAYSHKLYNTERYREQGFPKVFFEGLLMLFAFLLMWGGNRTRRPKEVRIKYDKGN